MKRLYFIFCLFIFIGCTHKSKAPVNSTLPIFDLTKDYPEKTIDLQEIAEVEYIPLETTDESIIGKAPYYAISEKYIVSLASPLDRATRFFDRKGKYLFKIDRYGQGAEEYVYPFNVLLILKTKNAMFMTGISKKYKYILFLANGYVPSKLKKEQYS